MAKNCIRYVYKKVYSKIDKFILYAIIYTDSNLSSFEPSLQKKKISHVLFTCLILTLRTCIISLVAEHFFLPGCFILLIFYFLYSKYNKYYKMTPDLTSGNEEDPRIRKIANELCTQLAFN